MARFMKRIVITAILLIALAAGAVFALYNCSSGTPVEGMRTTALNTLIDQSGVKEKIKSEMRDRAGEIAESYGVPEQLVESGVDMLAVDEWKVVDTPPDTSSANTLDLDLEGSSIELTTYDDPSIVSIRSEGKLDTFGQTITFEVPESARALSSLLSYAQSQDAPVNE